MIKKSVLLLFLIFAVRFSLFSQYYLTGQDPASVRWKQIKTDKIQLVFPAGYDSIASYYANVISLTSPFVGEPYKPHQKRITVVLHNQSTVSNAMVSPAPFHADFFEMPPQDTYPQMWQDQLALHEYRHVVQMEKMYRGFTKGLYYLFGQQGAAAVFGTFLPFWFIEGDAVYSETVHSKSGRGRVPEFTVTLKAQVLDKRIYKYDKALFGSYKDFVPDHYTLGYRLVTEGIGAYGTEMWDDMLNRVARKPYTLVPFTRSLKKTTGKGKVGFYNRTMNKLKTKWEKEQNQIIENTVPVKNKFYTSYRFPNLLSDGSFICEKNSIDDITRFVRVLPDGTEKVLFTPGFDFKESLSANDSLICWNEKGFDPRWSNRDYSVIRIYNFKTGKLKKITRKSRLFAPALSPDGSKIVAVHFDNKGKSALVIIDRISGKEIHRFRTKENINFLTPRWAEAGSAIVAVVLSKKGKQIVLISAKTGKMRRLTPFTFAEIKYPVFYNGYILFTGTFTGKDVLYALKISTGKLYKLKEPAYGAVWPSGISGSNKLVCSTYTADGYKPAFVEFDTLALEEFGSGFQPAHYPVDDLVTDSTFVLDNAAVPDSAYPVKKYSRLGHLFHPYSWGPLNIDADNYTVQPGITLMSQNNLSTAVSTLSYLYDLNEETGKVTFGFDYYGWYPVIGVSTSYGGRRYSFTDQDGNAQVAKWKETNLSVTVKVPLNLNSGKWLQGITPSVTLHQRFLKMDSDSPVSFKEDRLTIASASLFAYRQIKRSRKDIFPAFGLHLNGRYSSSLFSDSISKQMAAQVVLYLPGIVKHQGFRFYAGVQQQQKGYYNFSNAILFPRGFTGLQYPGSVVIKADYAIPIAYPDWDVPAVFYLKRIYTRLFYDSLYDLDNHQWAKKSSAGAELFTNWHFLSLFPEVELGVRYSQQLNQKKATFDFLFNVSF